jgi:hypothetical protein
VASGSAIGAIGWTGAFAFQYHIHLNFLTVSYGVPSLLGWPVSFILIYYVLINYLSFFKKGDAHYTQEHRTGLSVILLFQFVCLLPLFLVFSCDYGRLCFFWVTSSFVLFLLIPQNVIQRLAPAFFIRCANRINHCLSAVLRPSKMLVAVLMLFIGISPDQFSMGMVMKASVVYNVYAVLRDSILFLYGCVGAF